MKLIVFGGTFDPIHNGHVALALKAKKFIGADKLIIIPTNVPPHKKGVVANAVQRFNMCKIAFNGFEDVEVSNLEIKRGELSYTFDSVSKLKEFYPDAEIFLLVGSDMFFDLKSWKKIDEIFKLVTICVACRNSIDNEKIVKYSINFKRQGAKVLIMKFEPVEISSSDIRNHIKQKEYVKSFLPEKVFDYIIENGLYIK